MSGLLALLAVGLGGLLQVSSGCENCIVMSKEEKAMFRTHSDVCLPRSRAEPALLERLLAGEPVEEPTLKAHVYCVLLRCKVITKDGKLVKSAALGKVGTRTDGKNVTKILESCAEQTGDSPEELAWKLFRCGYRHKAALLHAMPGAASGRDLDNYSA